MNSEWAYESWVGFYELSSNSYYDIESDFGQDLNGDNVVGERMSVVEDKGSVHLVKNSEGYGFARNANSSSITQITFENSQIYDSQWSGWNIA